MQAALRQWPYCRGPRNPSAYRDRAVFAPPELTGYLFDSTEDLSHALAQADEVEAGLSEWSCQFPEVTFALIESDCFGGQCAYRGFACRNGRQIPISDPLNALAALFACVGGIEITEPFPPFTRGFFSGVGSGGYS